VGSDIGKAT